MYEVRKDEPGYALLYNPAEEARKEAKTKSEVKNKTNRYGNRIQLVPEDEAPTSLKINHEDAIGDNPNRGKQHGFHFTADNCIGCHACESACSEKNDLPAHIAFRSVGYVEGGTFPEHTRMNISMACNHCDDPVCLKGCPTRAYTKHPEYGAVIQDPDICFGCGYCTWVCPYNAPQLDPVAGQVEKCNMCVDRLEVGLKPACVSACVGNALDFGVIEDMPNNREAIDTQIPGFPTANITQPNIRFQQNKSMPDELTRTDSSPIKYQKDSMGVYQPSVDEKDGQKQHWNLQRLSSSENPLVLFTLSIQAALGMFGLLQIGSWLQVDSIVTATNSLAYLPIVALCLAMTIFGLLMSVTHLGKPWRFYRGYNNWRHSPVCKEGLGITFFMMFTALHFVSLLPAALLRWQDAILNTLPILSKLFNLSKPLIEFAATIGSFIAIPSAVLAIIAGALGLYYMVKCYRIPARPFWNHFSTNTHFIGNTLSLGSTIIATIFSISFYFEGLNWQAIISACAIVTFIGIGIEIFGLRQQAIELKDAKHEGAASHYVQCTTFGRTYKARNNILYINAGLALLLVSQLLPATLVLFCFCFMALGLLATALLGRSLFYVLVIPTTMPGAFFWKNKGFEEHARDIGMDHMPNSGVAPAKH